MGRYMTVVLKKEYQHDLYIQLLNEELAAKYGASTSIKFNTWAYLQQEADFINADPEGLKQLPGWQRPISAGQLHRNFFWLRFAEFAFKLSCCPSTEEARDAIAVCKWIVHTKGKYIDKNNSENYAPAIVKEYLNHLFEEMGDNLSLIWAMPQENNNTNN